MARHSNFSGRRPAAWLLALASFSAVANDLDQYLDMALEDLLSIEVSSVSKKAEALGDTAAAVYVVTGQSIRERGISSVAEALRGVPGVHVGRINAGQWAVSIRGFSGRYTNKLLVLVDGRSVYVPSFSGVYWDELDTLLDDIDRIEIIRGPGATLWGANAVNGIINIITRSAQDTTGNLLLAGGGNQERARAGVRSGFQTGATTYGRVFAKYTDYDGFETLATGTESNERWDQARVGFRFDGIPAPDRSWTVQGESYRIDGRQQAGLLGFGLNLDDYSARGSHVLARWSQPTAGGGNVTLQAYFDTLHRSESFVQQRHDTLDIDFQHQLALSGRHDLLWGASVRRVEDQINGTAQSRIDPEQSNVNHLSVFIQDEITVSDHLRLILGSKFDRNDFTGFEYQPNARLVWQPDPQQTFWASLSRAIRTPSRAELHSEITLFGPIPSLYGNPELESENLVAYEVGYRRSFGDGWTIDLTAFANDYSKLIGTGIQLPIISPAPDLSFFNNLKGQTRGLEAVVNWQASDRWRLSANYSYLDLEIEPADPSVITISGLQFGTPTHQLTLDSDLRINGRWKLNLRAQYVDEVPGSALRLSQGGPSPDDYVGLDASLVWRPLESTELIVTARNLAGGRLEYLGETVTPATEIDRMFYAQLRVQWP